MKNTFYVYHLLEVSKGKYLRIYEPFVFESVSKAMSHAKFFNALSGIEYKVCPCTNVIFTDGIN